VQDGKSVDPDSPASILVLDGMMKQHAEQRHHQLSHLLFLVTAWIDVSHREQPVLPYRHLKHGPDIQQYAQDSCTTLHWLDVPKCIQYKIGVTVNRCLHSKAPKYRPDCCIPVSDIASQRHLLLASQHHLSLPRHQLSIFGRQAFSVADPMVWNSLLDSLRDPALSSSNFRQLLKMDFFITRHTQRSRDAI